MTAAQPPAQQKWTSITIVHVKPDMVTDFEDFVKKETIPLQKKSGLKWRSTCPNPAAFPLT